MNNPENHPLEKRLARMEAELSAIRSQLRALIGLGVVIVCVIVYPVLLIPAAVGYLVWQLGDALYRRSLRKRREQEIFRQLSGRGFPSRPEA